MSIDSKTEEELSGLRRRMAITEFICCITAACSILSYVKLGFLEDSFRMFEKRAPQAVIECRERDVIGRGGPKFEEEFCVIKGEYYFHRIDGKSVDELYRE